MDTKITLLIFILSSVSLYAADTGGFQKIEPNKVPDELAMLSAVTRDNYEKIKTLQGEVSSESMIVYRGAYAADLLKRHAGITIKEPNELADIAEGTSEFKIDLQKNLLFKYMNRPKPMEYIDLDKGISYPSLEGTLEMTKIVEDKYEIESSPYTKKQDGTILTRMAEKNNYRRALIELMQRQRYHQELTDTVILEVRGSCRDLKEAHRRYEIEGKNLRLAQSRTNHTLSLLQYNRASTRDVLDAQNAANSALVDYLVAGIEFLRDTEMMKIKPDGMWEETISLRE